jgi:hypothetical protein
MPALQPSALQRAASAVRSNLAAFVLLTALNLSISWRLLKVEYTSQFSSVEGYFIAIARYLSGHWGDFSWFPLWHCGMPTGRGDLPVAAVVSIATLALLAAMAVGIRATTARIRATTARIRATTARIRATTVREWLLPT